jgi:hypothetical protein
MLKCVFVDTIYMNVMQVESESKDCDYLLCEDIEDYVKYEQHGLCIINKVTEEDLSYENSGYKNIIM